MPGTGLDTIKEKFPGFPIVMHRSSSVPEEEREPGGKANGTPEAINCQK
jgi:hypothetical protein